jgi:hypothetical protein
MGWWLFIEYGIFWFPGKGTGVSNRTDVDIFESLSSVTPCTLADMYGTLFNKLSARGYQPRKQNVSIGIKVGSIE